MNRYLLFSFLSVSIIIQSASAQVLVENFRNTGCVNCIEPDKKFESFIETHPNLNINVVYIHNNAPFPNDPFYLVSKTDVLARQTLYKPIGDPQVFVSGFDGGSSGSNESNWEKLAADPASVQYPGTLTASATVISDGRIKLELHATGSGNVQVRPFAMIVESGIVFDNPEGYGNPKSGVWNNIFRAMIPSPQGGPIVNAGTADFTYYYDPTGKPWNLDNCKIYAFMQEVAAQADGSSHLIYAFATASITHSSVASDSQSESSLEASIPNPAQTSVRIPFHVAHPSNVKIVISDNVGRDVATVVNQFVSESESFAVFTPASIVHGVYYVRMYADGKLAGNQKIIFEP
jgi:hypothetical protein